MASSNDQLPDIDPATLTDEQKAAAIPTTLMDKQAPLPYHDARTAANAKMRNGDYNVNNVSYTQPDPQAQTDQSVDAKITGTIDPVKMPPHPPLAPQEIGLQDYDATTLRAAAKAGGIDADKLPDSYFEGMSQHYQDMKNPGTLGAVRAWYQASSLGQFMNGIHDGTGGLGHDPIDDAVLEMHPEMAVQRAADKFFNANIQARIIDNNKYIDGNGNYNPPMEYKVGKQINDTANAQMALRGLAGLAAGGMAMRGAAQGMVKIAAGTSAFMAAHPQASAVLGQALKWTAIGKIVSMFNQGGSKVPPP